MPRITAVHHLSLTVSDLARSVDWYTGLLGFFLDSQVEGPTFRRTRLRHADAALVLTLTQHHGGSPGPFQETTVGLDHLAFLVPTVGEVEALERSFHERGVTHSGIKGEPPGVARIFFRDPDNIQLEVVAVAPGC